MSTLLSSLKFVKGAIAKKEIIDGLTHVAIENGTVRSFNGFMALSSPIALDLNCKPKAAPFIKAIENCDDTVHLSMTKAGKLRIKSGGFRVLIECIEDGANHVTPEGEFFDIDGESVYDAIKTLAPFVGTDASKPWSNGIMLNGQIAMATNNVIAIQYWTGSSFPCIVNLHRQFITEILRIKKFPVKGQTDGRSLTFHYEDGSWIRSNLLDTNWPDFNKILDVPSNPKPLHEQFFEGLNVVKPFMTKDGRVFFENEMVKTHLYDEDEGAVFELKGLDLDAAFNLPMLQLLDGIATEIDFNATERYGYFQGKNLRGVITRMMK